LAQQAFSIIAATFYGNRGAQAMLESVIGTLRAAEPGLRFHVFSYYPADDRRLVKDASVTVHSATPAALVFWLFPWALLFGALRLVLGDSALRLAPRAIRALAESRALVDLAGIAFVDGRERFLPFNSLALLPAWLVGTPVVKMPQAVGPFARPLNRLVAKLILPRCKMIWARGAKTREHLASSGFKGLRFAQGDDIAFNHKTAFSLTLEGGVEVERRLAELAERRKSSEVHGVIGLCPSSVVAVMSRKAGGRYEDVLVALVDRLQTDGFVVVLFPNATREAAGDAERNNDLPLIRRILARRSTIAPGPEPLAFDCDMNAAGIKRVIASLDVALVSRFHAMVGSLAQEVPTAVLGWSYKYAEVMARFGLERFVMDYARVGDEELARCVRGVFADAEEIRETIRARLPAVQESAARPLLALLQPDLGEALA
jgi:colanic acid/amylovoran biosynthesis protein